jgi:hypothetical protein
MQIYMWNYWYNCNLFVNLPDIEHVTHVICSPLHNMFSLFWDDLRENTNTFVYIVFCKNDVAIQTCIPISLAVLSFH